MAKHLSKSSLPTPCLPAAATPPVRSPATISRRLLLFWGLTTAVVGCNKAANKPVVNHLFFKQAGTPTPRQTQGPFYPDKEQADKDYDLTRIQGRTNSAQGEVIIVQGSIKDTDGSAIDGALVEIWQANTWGRYRHERDPNSAPLDPDFQGWSQIAADANGYYGFKTIKPGTYPAGPGWTRPPHIHFKVSSPGNVALTTQMYFPDHPLNREDLILKSVPPDQQIMIIAKRQADNNQGEPVFHFDIILAKISG